MPEPRIAKPVGAFLRSGTHFVHDDERECAALAALNTAAAMARTGNFVTAREICAAAIFDAQPLISARVTLLRTTLYALFAARGFKLLSRVMMAIGGSSVVVTVVPDGAGLAEVPRCHDELGRIALLVDTAWLDHLSPDDPFLRHLCDALVTGKKGDIGRTGNNPAAPGQLEPL